MKNRFFVKLVVIGVLMLGLMIPLALVMVITRKLDWYRIADQLASQAVTISGRSGNDRVATPVTGE